MHRLWLLCLGNSPASPIVRTSPMEAAEAEVGGSRMDLQRYAAAKCGIEGTLPCVVIRVVIDYLRARSWLVSSRCLERSALLSNVLFLTKRNNTPSTIKEPHPCNVQVCDFAHKTQCCCVLSRKMSLCVLNFDSNHHPSTHGQGGW